MTANRIQQTIKPNSDCPHCHGYGKVTNWVDNGPDLVALEAYCVCVEAQASEDTLEQSIEIVLDNYAYLKTEESTNAMEREAAFMDYPYYWH